MNIRIEEITSQFDSEICEIIRMVGQEFGAIGEGFGPSDSEVMNMSRYYRLDSKSRYFIAIVDDKVVGGGGIAAFNKSSNVCELRKLFLLSGSRGLGIGAALVNRCLDFAKFAEYKECYLDTLKSMDAAIALYKKVGFKCLEQPLPGTIHNGCDVWMLKQL